MEVKSDTSTLGMIERPHHPYMNWLRDDLWSDRGFMQRSEELTPVKANRYHGPRNHGKSQPHDHWELGTVVTGQGELFFENDGVIALRSNTTFLIPPRLEHGENSCGNIDIVFIGLRGTCFEQFNQTAIRHVNSQKITAAIEDLWLRSIGQAGGPIGPLLDGMARTILAKFTRCLEVPEPDPETRKIEKITQQMRQRLAENIRVPELARLMGVSTDYFRRVFRHRMNMTPTEYLIGLRMQQAMQLLEHSDLTVGMIAQHCGFRDPLYFSRMFRRKIGCSPLQYRRETRPAP